MLPKILYWVSQDAPSCAKNGKAEYLSLFVHFTATNFSDPEFEVHFSADLDKTLSVESVWLDNVNKMFTPNLYYHTALKIYMKFFAIPLPNLSRVYQGYVWVNLLYSQNRCHRCGYILDFNTPYTCVAVLQIFMGLLQ